MEPGKSTSDDGYCAEFKNNLERLKLKHNETMRDRNRYWIYFELMAVSLVTNVTGANKPDPSEGTIHFHRQPLGDRREDVLDPQARRHY